MPSQSEQLLGHGPHLLRGLEFHRGKPIFHSLGNFIGQNDLVYKLPADSYERFRVDPSKTPSELFRNRSEDGRKGFASDGRYWQTVVPICRFEGGRLRELEVFPVTLGHGQPTHHRGRPRLARGAAATEILRRFARLSEPYGTTLDQQGDRATVRLPGAAD